MGTNTWSFVLIILWILSMNNTQNGWFSEGFTVILFINAESLTRAYCGKTRSTDVNRARV